MLVSVIIPAFNAAAYIEATLRSVAEQTLQDYEVIVVDDCSTDGTAAIVAEAAAADQRIRMIRLARNCGPAQARNTAIAAAKGAWLALLDADDCYMPTRLERLIEIAERNRADMVSDNILLCSAGSAGPSGAMYSPERIPGISKLSPSVFVWENTREGSDSRRSFGFMQPIMRREFLQKHGLTYNPGTRFGEDFLLYVGCLLADAQWWLTPEPLYVYNVRANTLTESATADDLSVMSSSVQTLIEEAKRKQHEPLVKALRHHKRTIDHWRHNRAFKTALNQSDFVTAFSVAVTSRDSLKAVLRDFTANTVLKPFIPWIKRHFMVHTGRGRSYL